MNNSKLPQLLLLVLLTLGPSLAGLHASERTYSVTCQQLGLNPELPGGVRPLDQFLNNSDLPENERNCWVHQDQSRKNWVITPYYWGEEPDDFNTPYIEDALLSIKESRRVYKTIGRFNTVLIMVLSEIRPTLAEAFWIKDNHCYMEASYDYVQNRTSEQWRQTVSHESGHCFIMNNVPGYAPENYNQDDKWWDESAAEWLSTLVWTTFNREHNLAFDFDLDGKPYRQPYSAFLIFSHFANKFGNRATWQMIKEIAQKNSLEELSQFWLSAHLNSFFQDFFITHYQSQIADIGGGFYPREIDVLDHPQSPWTLATDLEDLSLHILPEGRLIKGNVIIPKGHKVTFAPIPPQSALALHFQLDLNGPIIPHLFTTEAEASCDEDKVISIYLSQLSSGEISEFKLPYSLMEVTDCGCDLDQTTIDQCMVGTWTMDVETIKEMIRHGTSDKPVVMTEVQGLDTVTLKANGQGLRVFDWILAGKSTHPSTANLEVKYDWQGQGTFRYGTKPDGVYCAAQVSNQSTGIITFNDPTSGVTQTWPINSNQGSMAPFKEVVTYQCQERELWFILRHEGRDWRIKYNRQN